MSTSTEKLSPYFDSFSEKIKQRRIELGLTVNALAEKSGVPYSNVSRINAGAQANPLLFNCAAMADTMGLSLDELCGLPIRSEDASELRKQIHALELDNAQKDAEIQRLQGMVNTATATADGLKKTRRIQDDTVYITPPRRIRAARNEHHLGILSDCLSYYRLPDQRCRTDPVWKSQRLFVDHHPYHRRSRYHSHNYNLQSSKQKQEKIVSAVQQ